jgi:MFS family permease
LPFSDTSRRSLWALSQGPGAWPVVLVAAIAMVGTLPGRTQGLGLITEPLIADLGIDRLSYAGLNFWATIIGSAGALGVGRVIDRFGSGPVLSVVALMLGAVVVGMSAATTFAAMAVLVTLTRTIGQSALSVVSLTMLGKFFRTGIDRAMAFYSIVMSVGFMMAFPLVGAVVQARGWRTAWLAIGIVLIVIIAPLGWLHPRARNAVSPTASVLDDTHGITWTDAIRSPAFWLFAMGAALYGLVASGIGLFNESILAERGFGPAVYYQSLVITAMTALAGNFVGGWLADRVPLTQLLAAAMGMLAAGLLALPHLTTFAHVVGWAAAMGVGGGLVMVLFFSVWPRVFGRRHLGRIQGAAQALTVLASAVGPLLLAWSVERTGSHAAMFRLLAGVIVIVAVASLWTRLPTGATAPPPLATQRT